MFERYTEKARRLTFFERLPAVTFTLPPAVVGVIPLQFLFNQP